MFGQILQSARVERNRTAQMLADVAGTSQPTISAYESGRKVPGFSTAERLLGALGKELVAVDSNHHKKAVNSELIDRVKGLRTTHREQAHHVQRNLADLLDADAAIAGLDLSYGVMKTRVSGITTDRANAYDLLRLDEILDSIKASQTRATNGHTPQLSTIVRNMHIHQHSDLPEVHAELEFYARAVEHRADPVTMRHQMNSRLMSFGYPWLHVRYANIPAHLQAVASLARTGNPTRLWDTLTPLKGEHE